MEKALLEFAPLYDQLRSATTSSFEADWTKVRGLEFREALQSRDLLAKKFGFFSVTGDEDFAESVSRPLSLRSTQTDQLMQYQTLHGEKILQEKIAG